MAFLPTTVAKGPCVPAAQPTTGTPREEHVARQKALFVSETWQMAKSKKISLKDAAQIVASRTDHFPDLVTAGKKGASLLSATGVWPNYRSWVSKLGKAEEDNAPDTENWRSLLPRYRNSRKYERPGPARFWVLLANLYENPNQLALKYAHRLTVLACREAKIEPIPSYGQARYYYDFHADQKAVTIARHGEEYFRNKVAGYIDRQAPAVDECWFSDHHIFDVAVRVFDPGTGQWHAVRPWLTAWMDWGSLYFTGWQIRTVAPNRDPIERSLRSGIEKNDFYAPLHIYIDNGKDYKAKGFAKPMLDNTDVARLTSVCELIGARPHFAEAYNARAKVIERIFGTVCGQFSKLWPSYRGSKPENRPEKADALWKSPEKLPTLSEFTAAFEKWLAVVYHSERSTGKILDGKSPLDARQGLDRLRPRIEPLALYKAFLREMPAPRMIQRGGVVRVLKRNYRSEDLWRMFKPGARVRVKVDPDDLQTAWIYTLDGREIGPASGKPQLPGIIGDNPKTIEQLREEKRLQKRRIKAAKQASAANRDLSRWLHAPAAPGDVSGLIPAPEPARRPERRALPAQPSKLDVVDPDLIGELDETLRQQSAERLAADNYFDAEMDAEDMKVLASIEQEHAAKSIQPGI